MNNLAVVDAAYKSAIATTVYATAVSPGPLGTLAKAHTQLGRLVHDGNDDLADTVELLRFARYRLAFNILPADHPLLELELFRVQLIEQVEGLEPGTHAHAAGLGAVQALSLLLKQGPTTLTIEALDLLATAPSNERVVVLRQGHTVGATAAFLEEQGLPSRVIRASQVRLIEPVATMVCAGPAGKFPSAMCNASKADSVCFVYYALGSPPPPSAGLFGDQGGLAAPTVRYNGWPEVIPDVADFELAEVITTAAATEFVRRRSDKSDSVRAALLLLEGGYGVWTSIADGSWMWCVDFDDAGKPSIHTSSADAIGSGSHVVFRSRGAAQDLVRQVADDRHGAMRYREHQCRWKAALHDAVRSAGGIGAAGAKLRSLGVSTNNLRQWMADHSIRPQRRSDFQTACEFAGLADEADELWTALSAIFKAHQLAGKSIRRMLQDAFLADGGATLRETGVQTIDLAEFGEMAAFRVEHRHPEYQDVDPNVVDEPFKLKGRGWHG